MIYLVVGVLLLILSLSLCITCVLVIFTSKETYLEYLIRKQLSTLFSRVRNTSGYSRNYTDEELTPTHILGNLKDTFYGIAKGIIKIRMAQRIIQQVEIGSNSHQQKCQTKAKDNNRYLKYFRRHTKCIISMVKRLCNQKQIKPSI